MRSRHILGVAILWGAVSTLGGQSAQAQAPSSVRFVNLLLMKQAKLIKADTKTLNMRDSDIGKLNAATKQRQINQLNKTLTKLHKEVLQMTTKLQVLSSQIFTDAKALTPPDPALVSKAFSNLLTVQTLSVRAGLGVAPATPTL